MPDLTGLIYRVRWPDTKVLGIGRFLLDDKTATSLLILLLVVTTAASISKSETSTKSPMTMPWIFLIFIEASWRLIDFLLTEPFSTKQPLKVVLIYNDSYYP